MKKNSFIIVSLLLLLGIGFEIVQATQLYRANTELSQIINDINKDLKIQNNKLRKILNTKTILAYRDKNKIGPINIKPNEIDSALSSYLSQNHHSESYEFRQLKKNPLFRNTSKEIIPNKDEYKVNLLLRATCDVRYYGNHCGFSPFSIQRTDADSIYFLTHLMDYNYGYKVTVNDSLVPYPNGHLRLPKEDTLKINLQLTVLNYLSDLSIDTFTLEKTFVKQNDGYIQLK